MHYGRAMCVRPRRERILGQHFVHGFHGKTVAMVTHDPAAARRATRTLHLEKGVLVEQGTTAPA